MNRSFAIQGQFNVFTNYFRFVFSFWSTFYLNVKKSEYLNSILNEILKKNNRTPDRSCFAPVEALYLATNRTSRGARGLPSVCTTKGSTVFYLIYFDNN